MSFWKDKRILVTGGSSFIGSHLVDTLLARAAHVTVADDFSSGTLDNLRHHVLQEGPSGSWHSDTLIVNTGDLTDVAFARGVMKGKDAVLHLAASHGGRGYIESHPAECCSNMILDQLILRTAYEEGVERFCFASSACVYPQNLQQATGSDYLLREEDANPFVRGKAFADLEYGWAKLMGEMGLRAYHKQHGMKTSAARIFTAYGPRENETHAIIALIAKAFIRCDPYSIWGTGEQDRNFTYVQDIVDGMIRASEVIEDGSAVNVGRADRITINRAAEIIFDIIGWRPRAIDHDLTKPVGVASRAADLTNARALLGWEPQVSYRDGFERTIKWYLSEKNVHEVETHLDHLLFDRRPSGVGI
ncbi:MAG TPA: NAD-dependent epimerase/dehydratase family protein [bacterium]|nr:NAD-dependent epimerase/dehydratase family protein [bacterium]